MFSPEAEAKRAADKFAYRAYEELKKACNSLKRTNADLHCDATSPGTPGNGAKLKMSHETLGTFVYQIRLENYETTDVKAVATATVCRKPGGEPQIFYDQEPPGGIGAPMGSIERHFLGLVHDAFRSLVWEFSSEHNINTPVSILYTRTC